ncbi:MAG: NTP transferase domain-containing protein [Cellulosilyticaceae bacterium]
MTMSGGIHLKFGAVIVAAGLSSRMKAFKPMLELAGSTMIKTAIKTLADTGIDPIIVITGHNADQLEAHLSSTPVSVVRNSDYLTTDMFHSAKIGMHAIAPQCDAFFFLPADSPLFSSDTLRSLTAHMEQTDCDVASPSYQGKGGHPLLIKATATPNLVSYSGDTGLKGALALFDGDKRVLALQDIGTTLDADHPKDYEVLQGYASSQTRLKPVQHQLTLSLSRETPFWHMQITQLLLAIDHNHSIRKSCTQLGISYSYGWKMIKIAEHQLGFPVLTAHTGGKHGGGSHLTSSGKAFLNAFLDFNTQMNTLSQIHFEKNFAPFFSQYKEQG